MTPKVFWIGSTTLDRVALESYLKETNQEDFLFDVDEARKDGFSDGDILTSFYAKLCYKSLVSGKNKNIEKVRGIKGNLIATMNQAHGSVFEHVVLNFVVTNCSRVYTHEQVRHRVGVAYSQTSGRYVRGDEIDIVFDPILEPVKDIIAELQGYIESYYFDMVEKMDLDNMRDFGKKKKITSALRRLLPNGQSNEMGMSLNLRTLRHVVQVRTSRHSEWEIRHIFGQVYNLVKEKYPLIFYGAKEEIVDGLLEVSGMKLQPYEKILTDYSTEDLEKELKRREEIVTNV